MDKNGKDQLAW